MSRAVIVIRNDQDRQRAAKWCRNAVDGARIEFKLEKRTTEQNSLMWAMLTDVATQKEHFGRKYDAPIWKLIFMDALGREIKFVPALDGSTVVPIGLSSSDLSKPEMSELIDFIRVWCEENGVVLHNEGQLAA